MWWWFKQQDFKVNRLLVVINTKRTRSPASYKIHHVKFREKKVLLDVVIVKQERKKRPQRRIFLHSISQCQIVWCLYYWNQCDYSIFWLPDGVSKKYHKNSFESALSSVLWYSLVILIVINPLNTLTYVYQWKRNKYKYLENHN